MERGRAAEPERGDDGARARRAAREEAGRDAEQDRAVALATHAVKVRIAGAVARTEIDETFTNDTDDVLEGIYRFPLPPDAQIERLALEVDGKMEEGAFVDRDRAAAIWRGVIQNAAPERAAAQRKRSSGCPARGAIRRCSSGSAAAASSCASSRSRSAARAA